nr:uncharacterized protein LOC112015277 [Quercus suber]
MVDLKLMMKNRGRKAEQKGPGTSCPTEVPPLAPPKAPEHSSRPTPDPQRKRPHEPEEREVGMPSKVSKQQSTVRDRGKRAASTESRNEVPKADVRRGGPRTWCPRLELDGAPILWDTSLRNYDGGRAGYVAEALQQPLLLPHDMESYRCFNKQELFLSLKRDMAMITQQIYVAEEWNRKFHLEAQVAVQSQSEVERVLGQLKDDYASLSEQLKTVTRERDNNKASLQTAETQTEEQRKQLRASEINLVTAKELVEGLRAELQKAREDAQAAEQAVQLAKESVEAERKAAYQLGVDETGKQLTEQFASVARDYCDVTWLQALDAAGVPSDSALRLPGSIYYHPDIRALPETDSPSAPQLLEAPEPSPVGGASPSAPDAPGEALLPVELAKDKGQGLDEEEIPAESQSQAPEAAAQTGQVADPVGSPAQE